MRLKNKMENNKFITTCIHCGYEWISRSVLSMVSCPSCLKKTKNKSKEDNQNGNM